MKLNHQAFNFEHEPKKFACLPLLNQVAKRPEKMKSGLFVRQVVFDVPMYYRRDRLKDIAKRKNNFDLSSLEPGDVCLFFNVDYTQIAIYGAYDSLMYVPAPKGTRISNVFLEHLTEIFNKNGAKLNYPSIMKDLLTTHLETRSSRSRKVVEVEG